jgi:hypothetical protein
MSKLSVGVDNEVRKALKNERIESETINDVLRRLLGMPVKKVKRGRPPMKTTKRKGKKS